MPQNLIMTMNNETGQPASFKIVPKGFRAIGGDLGPLSFGTVEVPFAPLYQVKWNDSIAAKVRNPTSIVSFRGDLALVTEPQ
jgi:hypothetical protein